MSALRMLWYYLWIAPHVLDGLILFLLVRRGLQRQFPMFSLYIGFEIWQFGVLLTASRTSLHFGPAYFHLYSVGLVLSIAIRFAVIREVFGRLLAPYPALTGPGKSLLRGAT